MRKILNILLGMVLVTGVISSCGRPKGPGEAFLRYADEAMKGDYAAFSQGFCRAGHPVAAGDSVMQLIMNTYKVSMEERFGGLRSVDLVRDSIFGGGNRADVRVRLHFGNGTSEETEYEMCKVDDRWMISLDM